MDILIPLFVWMVSLIFTLFSLVTSNYQWALYGVTVLTIVTVIFYCFVVFVYLKDTSDGAKSNE